MWDAELGFWTANEQRIVAGTSRTGTASRPRRPTAANPFTQTGPARTARPSPTSIYAGEGSIGQGYPIDPDPAVVGFRRIFADVGAKGSHAAIIESDSAIGGATDPGRSLRHAKISIQNVLGLRGSLKAHRHTAPCPTRRSTRATRSRPPADVRLRNLVIACVAASLGVAAPAYGHGDPTGHYLETDSLYPSIAARGSQAIELQLLGVLQAVQRDGYPVKVAILGNESDVEENPGFTGSPSATPTRSPSPGRTTGCFIQGWRSAPPAILRAPPPSSPAIALQCGRRSRRATCARQRAALRRHRRLQRDQPLQLAGGREGLRQHAGPPRRPLPLALQPRSEEQLERRSRPR